jgi:hypothetical protein
MNNMNITEAKYAKTGDDIKGAINFKENGIGYSVPNKESSVGNRHYDEIKKQVKEGTLTIQDAD